MRSGERQRRSSRQTGQSSTQQPAPGKKPRTADLPGVERQCPPGAEAAGCWLEPEQRDDLQDEVGRRIERAHDNYGAVLLREEIMRRLNSDPTKLTLFLEIGFAIAGIGASKVLDVVKAMNIEETTGLRESVVQGALDALQKTGERKAQSLASKTGSSAVTELLATIRDELDAEAQRMTSDVIPSATDDELIAMAAYWDQEFHTETVYERKLNELLTNYRKDVEQTADRGKGIVGQVAVLVRGRTIYPDDQRLAICLCRENVLGDDPEYSYEFRRWAHEDVADAAYDKQAQSEGGSKHLRWNDPNFVAFSSENMRETGHGFIPAHEHPEVKEWLERYGR